VSGTGLRPPVPVSAVVVRRARVAYESLPAGSGLDERMRAAIEAVTRPQAKPGEDRDE
jgi:hypothetical protein